MAIRLECSHQSITLSDPISEPTLEDICSNLIVLDSELKVWKFPHASVAEYFENQHKSWLDKAHEDVAVLLVSCLIDCYSEWAPPVYHEELEKFLNTTPDHNNHLDPRHPLQRYAKKYWLKHAHNIANQGQEATRLSETLKRFLGAQGPQRPSSLQYRVLCSHMLVEGYHLYGYGWHDEMHPSEKSIFGICVLGLHKLLKGWWDEDIDVSQVNDHGLDLLAIAAKYGHDDLCSELIDRGSDIHKELNSGTGSAFMQAIGSNQVKTARLFLDRGVDPNLIRNGSSPLCMAASCAESFVEPLLQAGADPNITCSKCRYDCALDAAFYLKRFDSAELLIRYGANVNLATRKGHGSLLGAVAYEGSLKGAKLLVQNGADVNAHLRGDYDSVLAAAIFGMNECTVEMVKYLIEEAGADPAILSSRLPSKKAREGEGWLFNRRASYRQSVAKYLIDGGHVQESVLLGIGFPREDLPTTEKEG